MKVRNIRLFSWGPNTLPMRGICLYLLAVMLTTGLRAQTMTDTLAIRFKLDSVRIDMSYSDNAKNWATFEQNFKKHYAGMNPATLRLDIYAGASPEGTAAHNRKLGEGRGMAIRRLIRRQLGKYVNNIIIHNEAARWEGLYDLVAASHEPWRDEVLDIIDMPAGDDDTQRDPRELRLRTLRDGTVWPVLLDRYMAPLRSGASAILSWQGGRDTIVVRDTVVVMNHYQIPEREFESQRKGYVPPAVQKKRAEAQARRDSVLLERLKYPAWAIKTNLLLWGVVAPNIEVEIPLGRNNRWSLEAEYFTPWFIWNNNAHASQFQNLGLELRCWLGNRKYHPWLHGWHIGLAVAAGYYDWEWKKSEGYQGEYINTYLNIGYQHRWGRHWGLDASVGFGVMATKYRHYYGGSVYPDNHLEPWDEHLIWHDTGNYLWPGPCHASLSIVYFFNNWPFRFKSKKL